MDTLKRTPPPRLQMAALLNVWPFGEIGMSTAQIKTNVVVITWATFFGKSSGAFVYLLNIDIDQVEHVN